MILSSFKLLHDLTDSNENNSHLGDHINYTTNYLERYSLNHLKPVQLLIDGVVESNPGPVNCTKTPKGKNRPKKTSIPLKLGNQRSLTLVQL